MKTQTSKKVIYASSLLLLPLLAGLLYGFSTTEVVEKNFISNSPLNENSKVLEISVDKAGSISISSTKVSWSELKKMDMGNYESYSINASPDAPEEIVKELVRFGASNKMGGTVLVCNVAELQSENEIEPGKEGQITQERIATPEMIKEYTELVKYYNNLSEECPIIRQDDAVKIERVLSKMSPEQVEKSIKLKCKLLPALSESEIKTIKESQNSQQQKATPEMISEYNKWAKHYREQQITEAIIQEKDFKRMMYIFSLMTESQRKDAEKLPPPPPPARIQNIPTPPPAPPVSGNGDVPPPPAPPLNNEVNTLAPPPPPPSPIESVKEWVEEGAEFFYNGKAISSKEAMEIVQKNNGKNLSVHVEENNSKKTVRLSDKL